MDLKQKWLEALRSGDYQQTKGTLKSSEGYCCLGVFLSAVVGEEPPVYDYDEETGLQDEGPQELYDFCRDYLPEEVFKKGINMNDQGKSFSEIADMIEENWK